jgi:hypothetical protein
MKLSTLLLVFTLLGTVVLTGQNTIFSEDFANGIPDDWSNVEVLGNGQPSSVWVYSTEGPQGSFATAPIESTTADNGWVLFDSDLNCNHPAGQDAWLISSAIDGTGLEEIWVTFETFYRSFSDRPQLRVGTDLNDLESWATIEVFPGISANDFGGIISGDEGLNSQTINLDISEFATGEPAFYIAFQFLSDGSTANGGNLTGCGYAWQIDDVALVDFNPVPRHDLVVSNPRHAPNFIVPSAMVDTVRFGINVSNFGRDEQTNVVATARIEGGGGQTFEVNSDPFTLEPDSSEQIVFAGEFFVPENEVEAYTLTYSVTADSTDALPGNNEIVTAFNVGEDLFQKDNGTFNYSTAPATVDGDTWEIGNYYFVPTSGFEAYQAEFSVASDGAAHQGQAVSILLYEITEDDDPDNFTSDDVSVVGFGSHTFTDEENGDLVVVDIVDFEDTEVGVELNENSEYLLMIEYAADMRGVFSDFPTNYDVATVINDGGWFLGGFTGDGVVWARMRIQMLTNANTPEMANAQVKLFPNPTTDVLNANIQLEEPTNNLDINILNTYGQVMESRTFEHSTKENMTFDTRKYPAGTYFLQIVTDQGLKTERFTVE